MLVMCISHHIHQIVIARELFFTESPARICGNLIPHEVFNPLHPNIRMQILQTVLYTFSQVLTGRTCLKMKSLFRRGYWGHWDWQFADLPFFWHLVHAVFIKNTDGFLDLVSEVVFSFSYLGSSFSSIWAVIKRLHWSQIAVKYKCYWKECMTNQMSPK